MVFEIKFVFIFEKRNTLNPDVVYSLISCVTYLKTTLAVEGANVFCCLFMLMRFPRTLPSVPLLKRTLFIKQRIIYYIKVYIFKNS